MAIKTNRSDVIATFHRYHGRNPNPDELKPGGLIDYLVTKPPTEVESLLAKDSPITKGKLWADYNQTAQPITSPPVGVTDQPTVPTSERITPTEEGVTSGTGWYDEVTGQDTPAGVGTPRPPDSTAPPPTEGDADTLPPGLLNQPISELSEADRERIINFLRTEYSDLTNTQLDFLIATFVNTDAYTSGATVPTNEEIAQIISTAATNAAADIDPYYTRISSEELSDYKRAMEDIRGRSETYMAGAESSYKQKLLSTKQELRARGLTFGGTATRAIGEEAALGASIDPNTGLPREGKLQEARRLDYTGVLQGLGTEAAGISTLAERRLGSAPVTAALGQVGTLAAPAGLTGLTTSLYTPTGEYTGTGSMAPTIDQQRAAAISTSTWNRVGRYRLTI